MREAVLTVQIAMRQVAFPLALLSPAPDDSLQRSFQELAATLEPVLYGTALRLCGDPADARDLVQDTFERGLRRVGQLPRGANVRAWLVTILHNRFIDQCRSRRREPLAPLEEADEAAPLHEVTPDWQAITPEELLAAVAQLDTELREVTRLHGLERRSYKDISRTLGIPMGTVATRLSRARQRLRRLLAGEPEAGEETA
jgi:RNA polymerase sigma-70 factor, ECF subfamily